MDGLEVRRERREGDGERQDMFVGGFKII